VIRALLLLGLLSFPALAADTNIKRQSILVLGDSISAAYGMSLQEGWVALLDQHLQQSGQPYRTINASMSGETTGGGLRRLNGLLTMHSPAIVIIELGGNDGLRGYPVTQMRDNLRQMVSQAQASGARVVLLSTEIPPNLGPVYTEMFRQSFAQVAEATGASLGPFLLEKVALDRALMQSDGIHPTAQAQPILLETVLETIENAL
jgi:acyl-CoA thioesterase-1